VKEELEEGGIEEEGREKGRRKNKRYL